MTTICKEVEQAEGRLTGMVIQGDFGVVSKIMITVER